MLIFKGTDIIVRGRFARLSVFKFVRDIDILT